jgi:hypothetical protein
MEGWKPKSKCFSSFFNGKPEVISWVSYARLRLLAASSERIWSNTSTTFRLSLTALSR